MSNIKIINTPHGQKVFVSAKDTEMTKFLDILSSKKEYLKGKLGEGMIIYELPLGITVK